MAALRNLVLCSMMLFLFLVSTATTEGRKELLETSGVGESSSNVMASKISATNDSITISPEELKAILKIIFQLMAPHNETQHKREVTSGLDESSSSLMESKVSVGNQGLTFSLTELKSLLEILFKILAARNQHKIEVTSGLDESSSSVMASKISETSQKNEVLTKEELETFFKEVVKGYEHEHKAKPTVGNFKVASMKVSKDGQIGIQGNTDGGLAGDDRTGMQKAICDLCVLQTEIPCSFCGQAPN